MTFLLIAIAALVLLAVYAIHVYNSLVRTRQLADEGWSGIDVQLKRRADLIPNLINTLRGYVAHERQTLDAVVAARNQALTCDATDVAARAAAEGALSQALGRLFALAESYPDLKASENFLGLQQSLETLENELQMARRYYNGAVRDLNIQVESFPSNVFAKGFGFSKKEYFELAEPADRAVPQVSFP